MNKQWTIAIALLLAPLGSSFGYELATHSRITEKAYAFSDLGNSSELEDILGISNLSPATPFGKRYYEFSNTGVKERIGSTFVLDPVENYLPSNLDTFSAQGWLMRGAIREDDYQKTTAPCRTFPPNPQDENPLNRPLNHFYDPVNDQSVSLTSQKAIDWGLGTSNAISDPNQEDTGRANPYTRFDAREAMYRAVTGQTTSGLPDIAPNGSGGARAPLDAAEGEQVRKAYWANIHIPDSNSAPNAQIDQALTILAFQANQSRHMSHKDNLL